MLWLLLLKQLLKQRCSPSDGDSSWLTWLMCQLFPAFGEIAEHFHQAPLDWQAHDCGRTHHRQTNCADDPVPMQGVRTLSGKRVTMVGLFHWKRGRRQAYTALHVQRWSKCGSPSRASPTRRRTNKMAMSMKMTIDRALRAWAAQQCNTSLVDVESHRIHRRAANG